jgi:chromosomal replication initiation ATPase DnaA
MTKPGPRQLALALEHLVSFARDDFLAGAANAGALALVERWPDWPSRSMVLVGPEGSGKSHLAAIWGEAAGARFVAAHALAGTAAPAALATGALVVENLAPGRFDERALFHLLNFAREERAFVLITARTPPAVWMLAVRDLASRLNELPVVALAPPDDALLRAVIVKLFADRQLAVDEGLVSYLTSRVERSFADARAVVEQLDREALRLKRPVTRALASDVLRDRVR